MKKPILLRWISTAVGRRKILCGVIAGTIATVPAQPASPSGTGSAIAGTGEEVVTIPEFEVSMSRNRDEWFASTAMSGTRTSAPVLELPYQVQVLTQEFLDDFQLDGLTE